MIRSSQRSGSARPVGGTLDGWTIQRNVISALVYRELKTRVSQVKFGVLGVFIEPLGVIAVFLLIFGSFRGSSQGIDIIFIFSFWRYSLHHVCKYFNSLFKFYAS